MPHPDGAEKLYFHGDFPLLRSERAIYVKLYVYFSESENRTENCNENTVFPLRLDPA